MIRLLCKLPLFAISIFLLFGKSNSLTIRLLLLLSFGLYFWDWKSVEIKKLRKNFKMNGLKKYRGVYYLIPLLVACIFIFNILNAKIFVFGYADYAKIIAACLLSASLYDNLRVSEAPIIICMVAAGIIMTAASIYLLPVAVISSILLEKYESPIISLLFMICCAGIYIPMPLTRSIIIIASGFYPTHHYWHKIESSGAYVRL